MTRTAHTSLTPSALAISALLACGLLPDELASGTPFEWREVLRNDLPNRADYEQMELGYYEHLLDAGRNPGAPVSTKAVSGKSPNSEGPAAENERLTLKVDDVREFVLKPGQVRDLDADVPWSTNDMGMRDRDYARAKPPGTFRVALAGDSIGAGWGVDDDEGFEPRLEAGWDARSRAAGGPAVEVLNFAVPGHGPGQRWTQFATIGWAFAPDLVIYEATPADVGWDERRLRSTLARGIGFDAPVYREALAAAGVRPGLSASTYRRVLKPLRWEILANVYRTAAEDCRSRGVPSVWVLIPRVGKAVDADERRKLLGLARRAGFDAVIDATGVYDGADPKDLAISPNDFHPNAGGHARIARALDAALIDLPALAKLGSPPTRDNALTRAGYEGETGNPVSKQRSGLTTGSPDQEQNRERARGQAAAAVGAEAGRGVAPR